MKVRIVSLDGKDAGTKATLTAWEHTQFSPTLLHQVAVAGMTNRRVSRAHTKDRSERRGGGRKPWRQKGTGRARHGSIRSPLWRKGGVTFGPRAERTYVARVPTSMKRVALAGALVGKVRDEEFLLLEKLPTVTGKTRELGELLGHLPLRGATLLLVPGPASMRRQLLRASQNLPRVRVADPQSVDVTDILEHRTVITTPEGLDILEKRITR